MNANSINPPNTRPDSNGIGGGRLHWFHWFVVISSLILTFAAWFVSKTEIEAKNRLQFDRAAENVVELLFEHMQKYEDALWSGVLAIQARGGNISHGDWREFAEDLRMGVKYPGLNGIAVIHYVRPENLDTYLAEQRKTRPDFQIYPAHNRNEYWPTSFIEPVNTNAAAVGLDMAFELNRLTAGVNARDTGTAQITGPITLVQDAGKTPGFLFCVPIYAGQDKSDIAARRRSFIGLVYAPFIVKNLMEGTLQKERRLVSLSIQDGDQVLYDEQGVGSIEIDPTPLFTTTVTSELYGRNWTFGIASNMAFRTSASNNQPMVIMMGGILIDAILLTLFVSMARSNQRAIRMSQSQKNRARELETMVGKLARSNEELERFAYVASHDLQEPLRMVTSFTQLLEQRYSAQLDDTARKYIGFASTSAVRMQGLIDDLLEYSRVSETAEKLSSVDCANTLAFVKENLREPLENSNADITYQDDLPTVRTNPVRFARLLQNLIGNALKYRCEGVTPKIEIGVTEQNQEWLFWVKDNGIGMKQEHCEKIFLPFKRLHGNADYLGSGLGLSICRKIVESFGGKIWAVSEVGQGSIFYFTMPRKDTVGLIEQDQAA